MSRLDKASFDAAVDRLRSISDGVYSVRDVYAGVGWGPYRAACIDIDAPRAVDRLAELGSLAVEIGAYIVMHVHDDHQRISLQVMRSLDEREAAAARAAQEVL